MTNLLTPNPDDLDTKIASEDEARQLIEEIKQRGARLVEQAAQFEVDKEDFGSLVGLAYRHRTWIALGYDSWEQLAHAEFSDARFFDSLMARRERVQALLAEGLSTRAIGDVLGISKNTAHRDALATVPDGTVAASGATAQAQASDEDRVAREAPRTQGMDGKERPRQRATTSEQAERVLKVAQRRAEGWSQEEIGEEVGVSQRTISTDDRLLMAWRAELSDADIKRLEGGEMSRAELAERANLNLVHRKRPRLEAGAHNGAKALTDGLNYLSESVVYADAWLEERAQASAILAPALANVAGESTEWMALEFHYEDVPDEELQLLSDDLGRATEWAHQARLRLMSAAKERGLEIDPDGYRDGLERKVESRRGKQ